MNLLQGHILVVDDNEMNRDLLSRRLLRQGHTVVLAENGRQALAKVNEQAFDVILLDIMMPEVNGFEVLAHIKANQQLRHIPIIIISAAEDIESIVKAIELGAEDYLPKPYNTLLLKARLDACLEKKRLHDQEQARMAEMSALQQIDHELNRTLDLKRAMKVTLEWAMRQSGAEAGLMGSVDSEGMITIMAAQGYDEAVIHENSQFAAATVPIVQDVIRNQKLEIRPNTERKGLLALSQSQIAIPVCRETAVLALILLENSTPRIWSESLVNFLDRLTDHAAIAIANGQMYEAVQTANLAKTEFVSFVSHELKVPMTSIKGYAELLLMDSFGPLNEAQRKYLKTIRSNVDRMARLVSDLSDSARIEVGQLRLEMGEADIAEAIEDVVASTRGQMEEKGQVLSLEIAEDLPLVWADRTRLIQILTNLVSNANKYTPKDGHITIRAFRTETAVTPTDTPRAMIQVSVKDNGLGMTEADQANIFQKFSRSKDEEALKAPGTGLGLNITKSLVEMHNGRIWFESKFREGTTFSFVLPVLASQ